MSSASALRFFARQAGRLASSHMAAASRPVCRPTSGLGALRRASGGPLLCNAPGGRPALAPGQRQQQRRLAAAAAGAATAEQAAAAAPAPTSAQRRELPKNFDPAASEEALYQWWESSGYFKPAEGAAGEPYTLSMPPPNVTGKLHMGHAMFATLQVGVGVEWRGGLWGGRGWGARPAEGGAGQPPLPPLRAPRTYYCPRQRTPSRRPTCAPRAPTPLLPPRTSWRATSACAAAPRCGCPAPVRRAGEPPLPCSRGARCVPLPPPPLPPLLRG